MGSTARGLITGFICRLCSKMNRYVILIYGEEGERMGLADKINSYLPVTVNRHDPLPKTVCLNCVARLENHTHLLRMITSAEDRFKSEKGRTVAARNANNLEDEVDVDVDVDEEEEEEEDSEIDYQTDDRGSDNNAEGGSDSDRDNEH